ncbi:hypothetical protein BAY1663_00828 [Pseudomonas sp. BAY1663]|uniref:Tetratricopeptide repeat protein n=1 Tax=Stutzerimonas stutzeri TaxID=316 RepID=A0A2N8SXL4_STUST|nr:MULTISPECIES: hypothetical protein [Pseudomonadaceae]EXF46665.1 hypothetical protein BAY1663_00828 [Pseudomonas sp. BAY1663]MCQ4325598.1 hypothetical protein [Stutzerimonas stutzeri]PNG07207.1 hypothetical protein CXK94_17415 [Stutzerimonas stutzeri]
MRRLLGFTLAAVFSTSLFAMHCPMDMAKIDEQLQNNPPEDAATLAQVKDLRAQGEELHNAGKHAEAVEVLGQALDLLGSNP